MLILSTVLIRSWTNPWPVALVSEVHVHAETYGNVLANLQSLSTCTFVNPRGSGPGLMSFGVKGRCNERSGLTVVTKRLVSLVAMV